MMRKPLLIVTLMLLTLWAGIPLYSTASSDVTGIPLIGGTGGGGGEEGGGEGPKSVSFVPITCALSDSGTSTGEIESCVLDSQPGIVDFTFSGDAGFYRIIITTSSGGLYHGSFII